MKVGLNPIWLVFLLKGKIGTQRQTYTEGRWCEPTGRRSCEDGGLEWCIYGPRNVKVLGWNTEARKRQAMIFLQVSEGAWHCQNIDVGLLTSRPVRQYISVTLSHQHMVFCYGSPRKVAWAAMGVLPSWPSPGQGAIMGKTAGLDSEKFLPFLLQVPGWGSGNCCSHHILQA